MNSDLYMYSESGVSDNILKLGGMAPVRFFRAVTSFISLVAIMFAMAVSAPLRKKPKGE